MAVKLAHAMGADHYFATEGSQTFRTQRDTFDLIINSVPATIEINAYVRLLALNGAPFNVGAEAEPMVIRADTLIVPRRSFAGSNVGSIAETPGCSRVRDVR